MTQEMMCVLLVGGVLLLVLFVLLNLEEAPTVFSEDEEQNRKL